MAHPLAGARAGACRRTRESRPASRRECGSGLGSRAPWKSACGCLAARRPPQAHRAHRRDGLLTAAGHRLLLAPSCSLPPPARDCFLRLHSTRAPTLRLRLFGRVWHGHGCHGHRFLRLHSPRPQTLRVARLRAFGCRWHRNGCHGCRWRACLRATAATP